MPHVLSKFCIPSIINILLYDTTFGVSFTRGLHFIVPDESVKILDGGWLAVIYWKAEPTCVRCAHGFYSIMQSQWPHLHMKYFHMQNCMYCMLQCIFMSLLI
jgi:hypothetical protein